MSAPVAVCPHCHGDGKTVGYGCPGFKRIELPCPLCDSTGNVTPEVLARVERAVHLRRVRVDAGMSLRELARAAKLSPVELSEIERGHREPTESALTVYRMLEAR